MTLKLPACLPSQNTLWRAKTLEAIAAMTPGKKLTAEQVREEITKLGLLPHQPSAWGPLIMLAVKEGVLERTGEYAHPNDDKSSARMNRVYRVPEAD